MSLADMCTWAGNACYIWLVLDALWGLYCFVICWRIIAVRRFKNEAHLHEFLNTLLPPLQRGDFDGAANLCTQDQRLLPQLALVALGNRNLGFAKAKEVTMDRYKYDFLADVDTKMAWINNMIKLAPMLGLWGTVLGMMGAFAMLGSGDKVEASALASFIGVALITTAMGLAICIPLMLGLAMINIRLKRVEETLGNGLNAFFEAFKAAIARRGGK